jgi:hypothetical protein
MPRKIYPKLVYLVSDHTGRKEVCTNIAAAMTGVCDWLEIKEEAKILDTCKTIRAAMGVGAAGLTDVMFYSDDERGWVSLEKKESISQWSLS